MHSSWLYYITGISGYAVVSQKAVRGKRERPLRNASRLIRSSLPGVDELRRLMDCPIPVVLATLALIDKETAHLDRKPETAPEPIRSKSRVRDLEIVIVLRPKKAEDGKRKCRGKGCQGRDIAFRRGTVRRIRSLDFGRVRVYVDVEVRRLRCRTCGKTFDEKLPFLTNPKARVTRALEWEIVELRAHMSITDVAGWLDVTWRCVKDAEKRVLQARYKCIDLERTHVIGIDEICIFHRARSDWKYITVVRDMESGAVVNVSRGKGGDALKAFAWRLRTQRARIDCVCMDMSNAYGKWVKDNLKGALVVYDHFHVIKAMNDRIGKIRRAAMSRISADVRRRIREIDVEKTAREAVLAAIRKEQDREDKARESLKGNRKLLSMNREDLEDEPKARKRLDDMLRENEDLGKAYVLKEKLRDIYAISPSEGVARVLFADWIDEARSSDVPELETMAKTIESHLEGVLGFWKFRGASNAKTEGFNNKIRWLVKQAYGYHDYKYFRLKVFDLPNVRTSESDA